MASSRKNEKRQKRKKLELKDQRRRGHELNRRFKEMQQQVNATIALAENRDILQLARQQSQRVELPPMDLTISRFMGTSDFQRFKSSFGRLIRAQQQATNPYVRQCPLPSAIFASTDLADAPPYEHILRYTNIHGLLRKYGSPRAGLDQWVASLAFDGDPAMAATLLFGLPADDKVIYFALISTIEGEYEHFVVDGEEWIRLPDEEDARLLYELMRNDQGEMGIYDAEEDALEVVAVDFASQLKLIGEDMAFEMVESYAEPIVTDLIGMFIEMHQQATAQRDELADQIRRHEQRQEQDERRAKDLQQRLQEAERALAALRQAKGSSTPRAQAAPAAPAPDRALPERLADIFG